MGRAAAHPRDIPGITAHVNLGAANAIPKLNGDRAMASLTVTSVFCHFVHTGHTSTVVDANFCKECLNKEGLAATRTAAMIEAATMQVGEKS